MGADLEEILYSRRGHNYELLSYCSDTWLESFLQCLGSSLWFELEVDPSAEKVKNLTLVTEMSTLRGHVGFYVYY